MAPVRTMRNILMELRKVCQHPYLSAPELENEDLPEQEQQKQLVEGCGKISFLKLLLPKLKQRGHRILLFSQFKIALDRIEDFLYGEGYKFLRLDGDVQQAQRQKSMDAFNAPDSEYFIFLLTTRAGGVGINLATADTVIVYDPDFNPHMDLQAIARSHRYGQKKRVLVFKLMTKNSVEEQIILSGKKKMVLDHLVVQQMGKENEEGEIDNILLHGAAALYDKTNADGTSASDIRYTSKDVDDLIDKVEGDAEIEAKAMEEREKIIANGEAGVEIAKPKESMSFGFAKIWEADQNRLKEIEEAEMQEANEDDDTWLTVMQNIEQARRVALDAENGKRLRRQAAQMRYGHDGLQSDESPMKVKNRNKKLNGKKKKANANDSSDADFALKSDDSDSDDSMVGELDVNDLIDEHGIPTHRGLVAGVKGGMTKAQVRALKISQAGQAAPTDGASGAVVNPDGSLVPPPNGPRAIETSEERLARKAQRKEVKMQKRAAMQQYLEELQQRDKQGATIAIPTQPPMPSGSSTDVIARNPSPLVNVAQTEKAQHVLQWLYHVLDNMNMQDDLTTWARMALPELPGEERRAHYFALARKVDDILYNSGQKPYFTRPERYAVVLPLLTSGLPVIPEVHAPYSHQMPPTSNKLVRMRSGFGSTATVAPIVQQYDQHLPTPYDSPRLPQTHLPTNQPSTSTPPFPRPTAPLAIAAPAQPHPGPSRTGGDLLDNLMDTAPQQTCTFCAENHSLAECKTVPSVRGLEQTRNQILNSDEPAHLKQQSLEKIDHILRLHAANSITSSPAPPSLSRGKSNGRQSLGPVTVSREAAIVIDDDDEDDAVPASKRAKLESGAPHNAKGKTFHGCVICGAKQNHAVASCPMVTAGPDSIKEVMRQFEPNDPIWITLKGLYESKIDQQKASTSTSTNRICPACGKRCGKTVRACMMDQKGSEAAGRKALKAMIRELERLRDDPTVASSLKERYRLALEEFFDVYLAWPK